MKGLWSSVRSAFNRTSRPAPDALRDLRACEWLAREAQRSFADARDYAPKISRSAEKLIAGNKHLQKERTNWDTRADRLTWHSVTTGLYRETRDTVPAGTSPSSNNERASFLEVDEFLSV